MGIGWTEQQLANLGLGPGSDVPATEALPQLDRVFMDAGLVFLLFMGGVVAAAAWWTVIAPEHRECSLKWQANQQAVVCKP